MNMKKIYVYADSKRVIDTIKMHDVPSKITWNNEIYNVWNSEIGYGTTLHDIDISGLNGDFYIYYDDNI